MFLSDQSSEGYISSSPMSECADFSIKKRFLAKNIINY
jgi:hypothetical protein